MDEDENTSGVLALFGRRLVELRTERGWSTAELAQRSELDADVVGRYERGEESAPLASLRRLAGALEVAVSELVRESDAK